MNDPNNANESPEYLFAQSERTRKLKEQLDGLAAKPRSGWYESLALFLFIWAINQLFASISLNVNEQILVSVGLISPMAALTARLYKSEKRIELLIKLLSHHGVLKP
ncbi:hypothetical protein JCM14076_23690 [Methylosoma difficile]